MIMKPRLWTGLAAVAVAALTVTGCATMNVRTYATRGADFRQYRTYNWAAADAFSTGDPRLDNNTFLQDRVRSDVEKQLATRGFEKRETGAPDLLLHYHANVEQQIDLNEIERRYGYTNQNEEWPSLADAGTLIIDVVDARTNRLLWRGWAEGVVEGVIDNQSFMDDTIDTAVRRILDRFPRAL
jgi:hypothetical protein